MKPWMRVSLFCCLVGLFTSIALSADENPAVKEFKMTAKKYEFTPAELQVKQGDTVKLIITALDRDHGIEIKQFKVKQKLRKGEPTPVEFVASQKGTFEFHCSEFCGVGHHHMKGTLIVE
ncbi:MAG: cupredoxin domain-containing protein [Acidobacteriia bacterium]|nr:cupredoxin domain-containing protein [Terriglobia bacterium]